MARKTVNVAEVLERANRMLETPDSTIRLEDYTPEQALRLGIAGLLETILHSSGNYHGYRYQPGVVDFEADPPNVRDETRRNYYS